MKQKQFWVGGFKLLVIDIGGSMIRIPRRLLFSTLFCVIPASQTLKIQDGTSVVYHGKAKDLFILENEKLCHSVVNTLFVINDTIYIEID